VEDFVDVWWIVGVDEVVDIVKRGGY